MCVPAGTVKVPERREGVNRVPGPAHLSLQIPAGEVGYKGQHHGEVQREERAYYRISALASRLGRLLPKAPGLPKRVLLVVVLIHERAAKLFGADSID